MAAHTVRGVAGGGTAGVGLSRAGHGGKRRDRVYVWRTEFLAVGSLENLNFLSQLNSGGN